MIGRDGSGILSIGRKGGGRDRNIILWIGKEVLMGIGREGDGSEWNFMDWKERGWLGS